MRLITALVVLSSPRLTTQGFDFSIIFSLVTSSASIKKATKTACVTNSVQPDWFAPAVRSGRAGCGQEPYPIPMPVHDHIARRRAKAAAVLWTARHSTALLCMCRRIGSVVRLSRCLRGTAHSKAPVLWRGGGVVARMARDGARARPGRLVAAPVRPFPSIGGTTTFAGTTSAPGLRSACPPGRRRQPQHRRTRARPMPAPHFAGAPTKADGSERVIR